MNHQSSTSSSSSDADAKPILPVDQMRVRLLDSTLTTGEAWNSLWKDSITPWDLGRPTPVVVSEVAKNWNIPPERKTLRSLVPGCGAGYDLITLARYHDAMIDQGQIQEACVVGLDISEASLQRAIQQLETSLQDRPLQHNTRVILVQGDYLAADPSTWKVVYSTTGAGGGLQGSDDSSSLLVEPFDFMLDYTFFCALPPSLRSSWGLATSKLLHPTTGRLLTLMYPVVPDTKPVAPPFPVAKADYQAVLEPNGLWMEGEPYESPNTIPSRAGKELIGWWGRREDNPRSKE